MFDFDTDVTFDKIGFAGLGLGESMKITIFDGSNGGMGTTRTVTDADELVVEKKVSAGTDIRIEQISGKARSDSISVD